MLTRVPEEIRQAEKAIDFEEYVSQEPLKFQFYYGDNNKAEIINTIYLEDGNNPFKLYLEVFNDSEQDVIFYKPSSVPAKLVTVQGGGAQAASAKRCHFQLRWEKDLGLKPSEIEIDKSGEWQVNYDEEDRFFSMYFLHKNGLKLKPNEKIQLGFLKLTANSRTVKSSNVELLYGGIGLIATEDSTASEPIKEQVSSKNAISIINYPSKTQIPLQFRVLGSNAILNDGTSQNTLKLQVINSPLSNNTRPILLLDKSSKFIVSFEQGTHADALVATTTQLNGVQIAVTDTNSWTSDHTANSTQWSFTPKINQLTAGQGIELTISNLVTSSASGLACIYIDYQNVGSYPDGRLVIPIEKTPLLYSGSQVGIGTKTFDRGTTKLKVNGDIVLGKDAQNARFIFHTRVDQSGDYLLITYDNNRQPQDGSQNWEWGKGITLRRGGNVGIGTTDPKVQLHVVEDLCIGMNEDNKRFVLRSPQAADGDFLEITYDKPDGTWAFQEGITLKRDGKVGIGTRQPQAKLHVNGNAVINDKVGIGTTDPQAKLHVNGDAVIKAKLNVNGDAVINGKVGIGVRTPSTDAPPKIHLAIGDDDTGLKQQGDGELAIYTNNSERVRVNASGNVGIGTTTPQAKLDVNGSVNVSGAVNFGQAARQVLNLYGTTYAIGVQGFTQYFRTQNNFAWYRLGSHHDNAWNSGGGTTLMTLDENGKLTYRSAGQFSSRKLKKNILDISAEEAVEALAKLNPVKYNLKADEDNNLHLGFIAEDVPDLVASSDRESISNDHIVALLTKVIKEQEKRILELAEKVETLEKKS